jgi:predicted Zn-dependent protease
VYTVKNGKQIFSKSIPYTNLFEVVDAISTAVQQEILGQPTESSIEIVDLPASNIISTNEEVIKLFIEASSVDDKNIDKEILEVFKKLEKTVELDPNCAICYHELAKFRMLLNQSNKEDLKKMMETIDFRPERLQLELKFSYYLQSNEYDKAMKLSEMWRTLYPQDNKPYEYLISIYSQTYKWNEAIQVGEDALQNGIKGVMYVETAKLYANKNNFVKADSLLKIFEKEYPEKAKTNSLLVDIYISLGEFKKAKAILDDKLILQPSDQALRRKSIEVALKSGEFKDAEKLINEGLSSAENLKDSIDFMKSEFDYLAATKQIKKAISKEYEIRDAIFKIAPKPSYIMRLYQNSDFFLSNSSIEEYKTYLNQGVGFLPQQANMLALTNELLAIIGTKDLELFKNKKESFAEMQRMAHGESADILIAAYEAYLSDQYDLAIEKYQVYTEKSGMPLHKMGRMAFSIYSKLSDKKAATKLFEEAIKHDPYSVDLNLEYAQFLINEGDKKKAKTALEKIIKIEQWADQDYPAIIKAKELLMTLN